jgi:hypothetical protein
VGFFAWFLHELGQSPCLLLLQGPFDGWTSRRRKNGQFMGEVDEWWPSHWILTREPKISYGVVLQLLPQFSHIWHQMQESSNVCRHTTWASLFNFTFANFLHKSTPGPND